MTGKRILWIDTARGIAILLILLHHAGSYERAIFASGPLGHALSDYLDSWTFHLRLPTFFFVSGLLASGALGSPPREPGLHGAKVAAISYAFWAVLLSCLVPIWPTPAPLRLPDAGSLAPLFLQGSSVAWYLWAIALCNVIAFCSRRLPVAAVLLIALALATAANLSAFDEAGGSIRSLLRCLPLYLAAFRLPQIGPALSRWVDPAPIIGTALLFIIMFTAAAHSALLGTVADACGIVVSVQASVVLTMIARRTATRFGWLGQRTLLIYVLHFPVIAWLGGISIVLLRPQPDGMTGAGLYLLMLTSLTLCLTLLARIVVLRAYAALMASVSRMLARRAPTT